MSFEYGYKYILGENTIIDGVLDKLKKEGNRVPQSHDSLLSMEPFESEDANTPIKYGRRPSIFKKESHYADGLLIDLSRITPNSIDHLVDPITIEIGLGALSIRGIQNMFQRLTTENIVSYDKIRFDNVNKPGVSTEIVYIAYK